MTRRLVSRWLRPRSNLRRGLELVGVMRVMKTALRAELTNSASENLGLLSSS